LYTGFRKPSHEDNALAAGQFESWTAIPGCPIGGSLAKGCTSVPALPRPRNLFFRLLWPLFRVRWRAI